MWGDPDIVRLRHIGDPPRLRDPPGVGDVGLDDIDTAGFEVRSAVLTGKQPFTELFKFKSIKTQVSESTSLVTIPSRLLRTTRQNSGLTAIGIEVF